MISGLPVISTNVGGIPSQLEGDCGILINPDSPKSLADSMKFFIDNPIKMKQMGENGKQKAYKNYNWKNSAKIAVDEYRKLIKAVG